MPQICENILQNEKIKTANEKDYLHMNIEV